MKSHSIVNGLLVVILLSACSANPTAYQKAECRNTETKRTTDKLKQDTATYESCVGKHRQKAHEKQVDKSTDSFIEALLDLFI